MRVPSRVQLPPMKTPSLRKHSGLACLLERSTMQKIGVVMLVLMAVMELPSVIRYLNIERM